MALRYWQVLIACLAAISLASGQAPGTGAADLITDPIPGLTFNPTFKQYSGYLNATNGHNLFYWYVESQGDPSKDPVVLWLNGGPGCSSIGGLLVELGPFHPNPDARTLFENVFTWNKFANVIFLESPTGVGFSYSDPPDDKTDDDKTAYYNFHGLRDFFYTKFPELQTRDFYVTGESYGGIYIPTLAKNLVDGIKNNTFPNIFKGVAIGNGYMNMDLLFNSNLNLYYYHGITGPDDWDPLVQECCPNTTSDYCDFYSHFADGTKCGKMVVDYYLKGALGMNDAYNVYQDCYEDTGNEQRRFSPRHSLSSLIETGRLFRPKPIKKSKANSLPPGTSDMSHQLNYDSTDADFGFQCWGDEESYMNNLTVKQVLHVRQEDWYKHWCDCCNIDYTQTYFDMTATLSYLLQNSDIRILVYNGDVDTVCNFLGDQWLIERNVAPQNNLQVIKPRQYWTYRDQIAGFVKYFERLDLLTVKGSGHFVPADRAGPALQMIVNFVRNTGDYSTDTGIDVTPKPLNTY